MITFVMLRLKTWKINYVSRLACKVQIFSAAKLAG